MCDAALILRHQTSDASPLGRRQQKRVGGLFFRGIAALYIISASGAVSSSAFCLYCTVVLRGAPVRSPNEFQEDNLLPLDYVTLPQRKRPFGFLLGHATILARLARSQ